jgi:hypothetical protein
VFTRFTVILLYIDTVNPEIEIPGLLFSNPLNPKIIPFFLPISKSKKILIFSIIKHPPEEVSISGFTVIYVSGILK